MKVELIEGWRKWYKLWSVRLGLFGTLIAGWFLAAPDAAVQIWLMLPDDLKSAIPPPYLKWIPILILVSGTFARVVKQNKLQKVNTNESA